jgi:DNA-binding PadR family transcriptional regulator
MAKQYLGEFEQMVLLAALQLNETAYAPDIGRELERSASRRVSRGALYATLDRLEQKGFLRWKIEAASSDRGGHRKRLFEVTASGVEVLKASRVALENLWKGLDDVFVESRR